MKKITFKRIISQGTFIPELDGLRFIAIASVVFFHIHAFLFKKDLHSYTTTFHWDFFQRIISHGDLGVPLFFVISGFILARPFANMYMKNGKPVVLKKYFLRRLTRLEPPYILIMSILFVLSVFVVHKLTFSEGLRSYLASITYTHNFQYGRGVLPLLNTVAWSLEIEVQFYILMPLLAKVFLIKNNFKRRIIIVGAILFFMLFHDFVTMPFLSILDFFEYFLTGLLLADLYVSETRLFKKSRADKFLAIILLFAIWIWNPKEINQTGLKIALQIFQILVIFTLYYLILFHKALKIMSNSVITNIGGMCYTIYLVHFILISAFGNPLMKIQFSHNLVINSLIYTTILIIVILFFSAIYFLTIERPCMDKDWYKKIFRKKVSVTT